MNHKVKRQGYFQLGERGNPPKIKQLLFPKKKQGGFEDYEETQ